MECTSIEGIFLSHGYCEMKSDHCPWLMSWLDMNEFFSLFIVWVCDLCLPIDSQKVTRSLGGIILIIFKPFVMLFNLIIVLLYFVTVPWYKLFIHGRLCGPWLLFCWDCNGELIQINLTSFVSEKKWKSCRKLWLYRLLFLCSGK